MAIAASNGLELCYDTFGDPEAPPLLLVMGLGAQMGAWEDGFCRALADGGHFVVRFDNRDCGLSTKFDGAPADIMAVLAAEAGAGEMPAAAYDLSDMAADAVGLLDALGIATAHIVGASMGGMIAQTIALEHPARVRTLTSIMSTTGEPEFFQSDPEAIAVLLTPAPEERDAYIENAVRSTRVISGARYFDAERTAALAAGFYDRAFYPIGTVRQLIAIRASGSRGEALASLDVPTLVIHGREDTLILPPAGFRTAEVIPHADLLMLGDMGHDLPEPLWGSITGAILAHTSRVERTSV